MRPKWGVSVCSFYDARCPGYALAKPRSGRVTSAGGVPWRTVSTAFGDVPFYIITFDARGECTSPEALERLAKVAKEHTDVYIVSHGWNNDWNAATSRYLRLLDCFSDVAEAHWRSPDRDFKPVFAGVVWPSSVLVMPWEQAPQIASADGSVSEAELVEDLLPESNRAEYRRLVSTEPDLTRLAELLGPALTAGPDELGRSGGPVPPGDLQAVWSAVAALRPADVAVDRGAMIPDDGPGTTAVGSGDPQAAGWNPLTAIRDAIRATTVLVMKDRAGRVGGNGVAHMLRRVIDSGARVAMIGHSYGCKVVLSAICVGDIADDAVDSVLLLEPALSCFAFTADTNGRPGGYRPALDRVRQPIITTYSHHDDPLRKYFHLAVRRASDLNEAVIAAGPEPPPSRFAALGGYGPHGVDGQTTWMPMPAAGHAYPGAGDGPLIAVNGSEFIASHGAVETPETAWALLCQTRTGS